MVTISRKTTHWVLLLLVMLSLVLRYPDLDHERNQTDSYFIHGLANDISVHGRAQWTIHPLSYIGYYPLSYPSGIPFLLSELGTVAETPSEASVLLMGMALGILQCVASFCFMRMFVARNEYVLLGTLLCIVSARMVDTTYWVGTARGPLAVLVLLTIPVVLEGGRREDIRLILIGSLLAATCFAVHHMAVFLILFATAYVLVMVGHTYFGHGGFIGRRSPAAFFGTVAAASILLVFGISTSFHTAAVSSLGSTDLFDFEPRFLSVAINAMASYTSQIGFIVPFAFLGIPYLFRRSPTEPKRMYPLAVLILLVPLIGLQLYLSLIVAPYLVVLGVNWLQSHRSLGELRKWALIVLALLVVSSLVLPFVMIDRWNGKMYTSGDGVILEPDVFNVACYGGWDYGDELSMSNSAGFEGWAWAVSGIRFTGPGISSLLNGEVTAEEIQAGIAPSDTGFPQNLYSWYDYNEDRLLVYFKMRLMVQGVEYLCGDPYSSKAEFSAFLVNHSRLIVYIDNNWPDQYVTLYSDTYARFPSELRNSSSEFEYEVETGSVEFAGYLLYETERFSVFAVQLPVIKC